MHHSTVGIVPKGWQKPTRPRSIQRAFSVIHGTLFLNYSDAVLTRWISDVSWYIQQADANWPAVMTLTKVLE